MPTLTDIVYANDCAEAERLLSGNYVIIENIPILRFARSIEMVALILRYRRGPIDPTTLSEFIFRPPQLLEFILNTGRCDVNTRYGDPQTTLLHHAVAFGLPLHVELLLKHGADPRALDAAGDPPFIAGRTASRVYAAYLAAGEPPAEACSPEDYDTADAPIAPAATRLTVPATKIDLAVDGEVVTLTMHTRHLPPVVLTINTRVLTTVTRTSGAAPLAPAALPAPAEPPAPRVSADELADLLEAILRRESQQ